VSRYFFHKILSTIFYLGTISRDGFGKKIVTSHVTK
jgi:hypothetical protein